MKRLLQVWISLSWFGVILEPKLICYELTIGLEPAPTGKIVKQAQKRETESGDEERKIIKQKKFNNVFYF